MLLLKIICCLAIGYIFGCLSTAFIIGKLHKIDIRNYGSGNAGTTNVLRTLGKRSGAFTFIGDFLKGLFPVLLVRFLIFPDSDCTMLLAFYTGLGVILGHNFPFWLHFRGGKGIASTCGVFLAINPVITGCCIILFVAIVFISRYVSLASIVSIIVAGGLMIVFESDGDFHTILLIIVYVCMAVYRHKDNIKRLLSGTERKIFKDKTSLVADEKAVAKNMTTGTCKKVAVVGAGTWGTALAIQLGQNGHDVRLWSKLSAEIESMKADRKHIKNLPDAVLPDNVRLCTELSEALDNVDIVVSAVASPYVRSTAKEMCPLIKKGTVIVNVSKGVEESSLMTLSDVISSEIPQSITAVLSGPSHAEEVSRDVPTLCVAGAKSRKIAELIQDVFMSKDFRVYTSPDVLGIELGGSIKNVIALAAGISDGLGFGDNTKAGLLSRGIEEISRLGVKMGGFEDTFYGLSGMGDLIVTCQSLHSRNRMAGYYIGQGLPVDEAIKKVGQVVEGVNCAKAALKLSKKYHVNMPIIEQINAVLFDNKPVSEAVDNLFSRKKVSEHKTSKWSE